MTARKLYLGIDATSIFKDSTITELWKRSGLDESDRTEHGLHITVQYCGKNITDDEADKISRIWDEQMRKANLHVLNDTRVTIDGPKFALYGKENDQLVVLCDMSDKFKDAVKTAREEVTKAVPEVPPSDFDFSAHITLGESKTLPDSSDLYPPMRVSTTFTNLTMFGDGGDVRGIIRIYFQW